MEEKIEWIIICRIHPLAAHVKISTCDKWLFTQNILAACSTREEKNSRPTWRSTEKGQPHSFNEKWTWEKGTPLLASSKKREKIHPTLPVFTNPYFKPPPNSWFQIPIPAPGEKWPPIKVELGQCWRHSLFKFHRVSLFLYLFIYSDVTSLNRNLIWDINSLLLLRTWEHLCADQHFAVSEVRWCNWWRHSLMPLTFWRTSSIEHVYDVMSRQMYACHTFFQDTSYVTSCFLDWKCVV